MTPNKTSPAEYLRINKRMFLLILIGSNFCLLNCSGKPPDEKPAKTQNKENTIITGKQGQSSNAQGSHNTDWRDVSIAADSLIDNKKYAEAEKIFNRILPQAKKEAPNSPEYALLLCRLGSDLYALKKYPEAHAKLQESISILNRIPQSTLQRQILWRSTGTDAAALLSLKKYAEAEPLARKVVAYAIAFPDVAKPRQVKIAYLLLYDSLLKQKKFDEAVRVKQIMTTLEIMKSM